MDRNVICIEECNPTNFEEKVDKLIDDGYVLESSSCNSRHWKAIMVKDQKGD